MNWNLSHGPSTHPLLNKRRICLLYSIVWGFWVAILAPSSATAQVFKCMQNGQFVFQSVPCHPSQGKGVQSLSCPKSSLEYERIIQNGKDTSTDRFCVTKARERERQERHEAERQLAIEQKKIKEQEKREELARKREWAAQLAESREERRIEQKNARSNSDRYSFRMNDAFTTRCVSGISGTKEEIEAAFEREMGAPCRSTEDRDGAIVLHCKKTLSTLIVSTQTLTECEEIRRNLLTAAGQ